MLGWPKNGAMRLRVASCLLILETLGHESWSEFISPSKNFDLG
jgi:hypothetical protein